MEHTFCAAESCHGCPERVVCRCLNITEQEIVGAITTRDLSSIRELRRHTGAGDGCTCCHEVLKEYLARYSLAVVCGS
jgi:bacterioferritin-associated ferredoxin